MLQEDRSASLSSSAVLQFVPLMSNFSGSGSPYPCLKELNSEQRGLCLIHLLKACTNHVAAGNTEAADICLYKIAELASPDGDTIQRISAYFSEALADRLLKSWPGLRKALNSTKMFSMSERFLAQRLFFDLCPFLKISYLITNQAIVEAMEGERVVHVIDLCSFEPAQWVNLIQTLSMRPEGPPFLKITGIHEQKEVLDQMALRLTEEAENLNIPFQFYPVVSKLEKLDVDSLRVKTGEALAISSVLKLHNLLAADDETSAKNSPAGTKHLSSSQLQRILMSQNQQILGEWLKKESSPIDCTSPDSALSPLSAAAKPRMGSFLSELRSLSPKIMVITEQESNNNSLTLMERVDKALNFYAALFDCLESTVSRASMERQKLEKFLFGEEINNIITSEGMERKERHEKLDKWILRLELAGFGRIPLSYHCMLQASTLLRSFGYDGCKIREENGCVVICWQDAPLFSVSAWRFRRYE